MRIPRFSISYYCHNFFRVNRVTSKSVFGRIGENVTFSRFIRHFSLIYLFLLVSCSRGGNHGAERRFKSKR